MAAFVLHALRKKHPLIDLGLFKHRQLTLAVITMSLFAIAFFGSMLLFPSYFLQVRGEETLPTGLLLAPQGIGAMLSMPIAGKLTDKMGPGRFVLSGIVLIALGMGVFTQIGADTSYVLILGALFVMGLGMGMTMMPIMTAALASLTHHEVARGSTLMNIIQQAAGSVGTAVMSVILTNATLARPAAMMYSGALQQPGTTVDQIPDPIRIPGQSALAESFNSTFWVALVLIVLCLIPAAFLPRKRPEIAHEDEGADDGVVDSDGAGVADSVDAIADDAGDADDAAPALPRH
jgi:MFS family permease